jgi:large subunit ribosomal protein L6
VFFAILWRFFMSRIGKKPILIPKDVKIKLEGDILKVKGPKGELSRKIHPKVQVNIDGDTVIVSVADETRESASLHGLFRILIDNMVTGVTKGFERILEIVGVGYRAELKGRTAIFNLGYSHPIDFELPDGIDAKIEKTKIILEGIDNDLLGKTAAKIRGFRKPEPYKGKGIKYADEMIRRKAGKAGATT